MKSIFEWMKSHPLISFFVLAYAFSWITFVPYVLAQWGLLAQDPLYDLFHVIHTFGPAVAAVIMVSLLEGKEGLARIRQSIRQWRVGRQWYWLILLGIPLLLFAGIAVQPGALKGFNGIDPKAWIAYPFTLVAVWFGGGPLGEEIGWRGFALPRMQPKFGALKASLLLGVLWTFWHLEDFLTPGQGGGPGTGWPDFWANFVPFFVLVMSLAVIFTWIFNRTGGSLFAAILAHASVNTPQVVLVPFFPAVNTTVLNTAAVIGFGLAALAVVIVTRGQLGYQPE